MIILAILTGTITAAILGFLPGMHAYNVLGIVVWSVHCAQMYGHSIPIQALVPGTVALITAFAIFSAIPAVYLAAPEESGFFVVQPGRKYLQRGRGFDAVAMTAIGAMCALTIMLPLLLMGGPHFLPILRAVLTPHQHWIVWCVIVFMLQSEWPRGGLHGQAGTQKLLDGWRSLGVGLITFFLSGLLGFLLFYRSPVPPASAFQSLMPAFVGLFTLPSLILALLAAPTIPAQTYATARLSSRVILKGTLAGTLGGAFAAFIPGITGGVGGMLAGHATATRDDRTFLISQGASKTLYYTGGLLLLLVPGLHLQRGGAAALLSTVYQPAGTELSLGLAAAALSAATALLFLRPASRLMACLILRFGSRRLSSAALLGSLLIVITMTGIAGLGIATIATGIGLLPLLYGGRRMNCLGIILLPLACNLSGVGTHIANLLGLLAP
ncbi:MAG: tripartite tricarboxylate transporter permease [Kiritimatiellae bacterium]|nr:tripartite tricarboxylate transporter permease [Kiritimatiellia bacterium]